MNNLKREILTNFQLCLSELLYFYFQKKFSWNCIKFQAITLLLQFVFIHIIFSLSNEDAAQQTIYNTSHIL